MRVVLITETWRPEVDGVVTRLAHTVDALLARGHAVQVLAPTVDPTAAVDQVRTTGVVIPFVDRHRRWGLPHPGLGAAVEAFRPDVVHVVNPVMFGTAAVRGLAGRHPLVASIHTDLARYAAHYGLGFTRPALRALTRSAYRHADLRLATSAFGVGLLAELGAGPAGIWPAAVDEGFLAAGRARRGDRGPDDVLRLLGVGRLAPEKDWDALLPLMRAGALDGRELRLTLVGDGPERARLERLFAGTATVFRGMLHGADLIGAYAAADALLSASTTETVGLTWLEAVATGLPVVAVDSPQLRDTLRGHGRVGVVGPGSGPGGPSEAGRWAAALRGALATSPAAAGAPAPTWGEATETLLDHYRAAVVTFRERRTGSPAPRAAARSAV